jgi:uncharacterized membrane protein YkoI
MGKIWALALAAVLTAGPAAAQSQFDDHERARRMVQNGEIVPLRDVLAEMNKKFQGTMLEVELQNVDGRWLYDIRLLTSSGWILDLFYDARTKKLVEVWGGGGEKVGE